MSMMIPIEELIQDKCYEVENADYKALVEVEIINGEYCGRNDSRILYSYLFCLLRPFYLSFGLIC